MSRAGDLRTEFDATFARAPAEHERFVELLAIRLGGEPYAISLADVSAVHAGLEIVPLPTPSRELLGVAAIGAAIVPVYDLRALLRTKLDGAPRWAVIDKRGGVAYAFDGFEGSFRFTGELRGVIERGEVRVPVIDMMQFSSTKGSSKEP
jgi:purine-binding chemotaxis protein CheW